MSIGPPGNVDDLEGAALDAWSEHVSGLMNEAITQGAFDDGPSPFYNPSEESLAATPVTVTWPALSGKLRTLTHLSEEDRWELADRERLRTAENGDGRQDEYCEWSVSRDSGGGITGVTFTSEVPDWWGHLARRDPDLLVRRYRELVGVEPPLDDLFDGNEYNPQNQWNDGTRGPLVHLGQGNNNLWAAISLAAAATVVREQQNGEIVTDTQVLMGCANLGDKDRFSDPSIASTVNAAAAKGARITLADPPGLYLRGIRTEGMRPPRGHEDRDPADFWVPIRGDEEHRVRARFEVPDGAFNVSDITLDGKPILTGAQLAQRVDVFITVLVHDAHQKATTRPCGA